MHYPLISRFQGALLGLAVGTQWDRSAQGIVSANVRPFQHSVPLLFSLTTPPDPESLSQDNNMADIAIDLTRYLIQAGNSAQSRQSPLKLLQKPMTASQLTIATLPIQLFCHENSQLLEQQLSQTLSQWSRDSTLYQQVLAIGLMVGQILKNQFQPTSFARSLQQELIKLVNGAPSTAVIGNFEMVQRLLRGRADLQKAVGHITANAALDPTIPLALYCFLSTSENMELALQRSARLSGQFPQVSALTGMLSGAYNTTSSLPLEWQSVFTDPDCPLAGMMIGKDLRDLATHLLAVWSGAEDPSTFRDITPAIAAPGVIRPVEYR